VVKGTHSVAALLSTFTTGCRRPRTLHRRKHARHPVADRLDPDHYRLNQARPVWHARGRPGSSRPDLFSVATISVGGVTPGFAAALCGLELEAGETPVRQGVEPGLKEGFAVVLVVEIVGVFPEVADQQRRQASRRHGSSGPSRRRTCPPPARPSWLVERIGAKALYLWCFSAFTLSSALCGVAKSVGVRGPWYRPITHVNHKCKRATQRIALQLKRLRSRRHWHPHAPAGKPFPLSRRPQMTRIDDRGQARSVAQLAMPPRRGSPVTCDNQCTGHQMAAIRSRRGRMG
jgi:hypothetical protein